MISNSTPDAPTRLVLADDHRIFLEGLERLLECDFEIVGTAANGPELVEVAVKTKPDIIITDYSMPGMTGLQAISHIRDAGVQTRVIVLTMHLDTEYAAEAIECGVDGYVLKQAASTELVSAIEESLRGGKWLSPSLAMKMYDLSQQGSLSTVQAKVHPVLQLTVRQREILRLLVEGRIAKEIAATLNISRKTVEYHKYRMMGELGVATSAELIRLGVEGGLGD